MQLRPRSRKAKQSLEHDNASLRLIYKDDFSDEFKAKVTETKFREWHAARSKFLAIAGGGSMYALVLLAGLELKQSITTLKGSGHMDLGDVLRCPPQGKCLKPTMLWCYC